MPDAVEALILDLLEWVGPQPRPYAEVMDAWRTSCPHLPVWEEAADRGFIERRSGAGADSAVVAVTPAGARFLDAKRASKKQRDGGDRAATAEPPTGN